MRINGAPKKDVIKDQINFALSLTAMVTLTTSPVALLALAGVATVPAALAVMGACGTILYGTSLFLEPL